MKRVGLYGGSFDPIHNGHLNLAIELMEKCQLEEVWFIPAALSPHKEQLPLPAHHRLEMVRLATESLPCFRVLDLELNRAGPSYSVDTVEQLVAAHPSIQFHLLLGDDNIRNFHSWHRVNELVALVPLLIGSRHSKNFPSESDPKLAEAIRQGRVETAVMEISATALRDRLKGKLHCGHLVPYKVLDYIHINQLYC